MFFNKQIVIILSPEPWGTNWLSKHHYAYELARLGNRVFFLNPPVTRINPGKVVVKEIDKDLFIVNYSILPGINGIPAKFRKWYHQLLAAKILRNLRIEKPDVVWSFDPFVFQDLDVFNASIKIYHPVDVHKAKLESSIKKSADFIFSTSDFILDRFNKVKTPKFKLNHGLSSRFLNGQTRKVDLPGAGSNIKVCYLGNLQYPLIDFEVIEKMINRHPETNFYFIGPESSSNLAVKVDALNHLKAIKKYPNTYFLGEVQSQDLPSYLNLFDLFLIVYKGSKYPGILANPHKVMEYLSTGKPVIASYTREYEDSDLIEMVENNNDLPALFDNVISNLSDYNQPDKTEARRKFAFSNTYSKQIERIEKILTEHGF